MMTSYQAARHFITQRPGFDCHNYSTRQQYAADGYRAAKDRLPCLALLDYCQRNGVDITGRTGRIEVKADGVEYITGQYFPTEYRRAMRAHLEAKIIEAGRAAFVENHSSANDFRNYARAYGLK